MYADTYLRVRVTATNSAGQTIVTSKAVGPVVAGAPAKSGSVGRSSLLHVGRARVSWRTVSFAVTVDGVTGKPQATAATHGRSVRLHSRGSGTHFTFSGRLSRGRWVVTVTLVSRRASFTILIKR